MTTRSEIERLVMRLGESLLWNGGERGQERIEAAGKALMSAIDHALAERDARIAELDKELDEISPRQKCARCGVELRWHQMVIEEGDEWECYPCNERENARERAALAPAQEGKT